MKTIVEIKTHVDHFLSRVSIVMHPDAKVRGGHAQTQWAPWYFPDNEKKKKQGKKSNPQ
jgi:hypothetical protein